jgi:hypothetical protein
MKMTSISIAMKYDSYDHFELKSKPGKKAGKLRRYIAWPFFSLGLAILFGMNSYDLTVNGRQLN